MKKSKVVLVMLLLLTLALTACHKTEVTPSPAPSPEPGDTPLTVGFIYVAPIGNEGFSYAHDQARLYLEEKLGVKTLYRESVPETSEVENVIATMVDEGAKVIFGTSFGFGEYMQNVADQYPDVAFLHCSGYLDAPNMNHYFGRMYEPRFLSGLVAGMKTQTNKIGYVAAYGIPEVIRGINAFTLGVRTVNPEAEVHVVWTHTWYDPGKEKEAAISLIDNGADVIAQHQDTAAPQQGAEEKGVFTIGYHSDTRELVPDAYLTAPIWDFRPYYEEQVTKYMAGEWKPENVWLGMKEGMVLLAPLSELAPEGAEAVVEEYRNKIISGEFHPFQGPIKNQQGEVVVPAGQVMTDAEMLEFNFFVEGVVGTIQ